MARTSGKARQRARKRKQASVAGLPDAAEIERRLDKAMHKAEAGDPGDAERRLAGLAKQAPRHAGVQHALGYVRHLLGREETAIKALSLAVEIDPHCATYRNSLAVVLHQAGRFEEAEREGRAAVLA